jgi:hypothetical protein
MANADTVKSDTAPTIVPAPIQVATPDMPLLKAWVAPGVIAANMPQIRGILTPLTKERLPVIDWRHDFIDWIHGMRYNNGICVNIGYADSNATTGHNGLFFLTGENDIYYNDIDKLQAGLHLYPNLVEADSPIIAFTQYNGRKHSIHEQAILYSVNLNKEKLDILPTKGTPTISEYLELLTDFVNHTHVINNRITGETVALCPPNDTTNSHGQIWNDVHRLKDGSIVLAGFEEQMDDRSQLIWAIRQPGDTGWKFVRRVFNIRSYRK